MFYGGLLWGAGSWMGTMDTVIVRNNTIDGVVGEGIVLYEHVDYGVIDHNTFTNIVMNPVWYRGQNNVTFQTTYFTTVSRTVNPPTMQVVGEYGMLVV